MISLYYLQMPPLLRFVRKIAIARSGLSEDQRLPSEDDKWLEFGNHCNKERVLFIVYADLECILRKTESDKMRRRTRISGMKRLA